MNTIDINNFPDGVLVIHSNSTIECNEIFTTQLKITQESLFNDGVASLPELIVDGKRLSFSQHIENLIMADADSAVLACSYDDVLCKINKEVFSLKFSLINEEENKGVLVTSRDITSQYKLTEHTQRVNDKFNKCQAFSKLAAWEWNIKTNDLFWSDEIYELIGYEPGEIEPNFETFVELTHPDDRESVSAAIGKCLEDGIAYEVDHRLHKKSGELIWVKEKGNITRDENGEPEFMLGIAQEVTEIKNALEALKKSETQFRAVFNSSGIGIALLSTEGHPIYSNPKLQNMLGYSADELSNMVFTEFTHPDDANIDMNLYMELIDGKRDFYQLEKRYIHKTGKIIWGILTVSIVFDEQNQPLYIVGMVQDINEQKEMEQESARLQRELNQRHKMESLGQLTGGIAHDFNNLLAIISGFAELSMATIEEEGNTKLYDYLKQIQSAENRATSLVRQMLSFSRKDTSDIEPLCLSSLVNSDIKLLRATLPTTIQIEVDIEQDLPLVMLNEIQLNQILMNLAINARDAMNAKGKLTIKLGLAENVNAEATVSHQTITGDWVELSIRDTGVGIEKTIIDDMFTPFFTTKPVGEGTGMGLSVVYGIIQNCNGHIIVESGAGEGTIFRMLFPPVYDKQSKVGNIFMKKTNKFKGNGEEVMVVDDEHGVASFIGELLILNGYQSKVVTDSRTALEIFQDNPDRFELVITDQTMPGMSGLELIEELRKLTPKKEIILCSGYSDKINEDELMDNNIHFFKKPLSSQQLVNKVCELLENKKIKTSI